jgi:hypothetical protein
LSTRRCCARPCTFSAWRAARWAASRHASRGTGACTRSISSACGGASSRASVCWT